MIRKILPILAIIASTSLLATSAHAVGRDIKKTVPANKTTTLIGTPLFAGMCTMVKGLSGVVIKQAKHGKLRVRIRKMTLPKGSKCGGQKAEVFFVTYTPKRGYRGKDTGRVKLTSPNFGNVARGSFGYSINLTVK